MDHLGQVIGMHRHQGSSGELGHIGAVKDHRCPGDPQPHNDQGYAKHRVELTGNFIDGQERGNHVVDHDRHQPEHGAQHLRSQSGQKAGRSNGEIDARRYQQHNGEHAHYKGDHLSHVKSPPEMEPSLRSDIMPDKAP